MSADLTLASLCSTFAETAVYPADQEQAYLMLGLLAEAGETANVFKKVLRDDDCKLTAEKAERLADELGDVLWYAVLHAFRVADATEDQAATTLLDLSHRSLEREGGSVTSGILDLASWAALGDYEGFDSLTGVRLVSDIVTALRRLATMQGDRESAQLLSLSKIAAGVIVKLQDRQARGVLQGSGDKR
jgi:NTP pyrophosphatase (non-canonical NTP hydrolase)